MPMHLMREIEKLKKKILELGALVEQALQLSVQSLKERDVRLASQVIDNDIEIDQIEVETEEACLKILALYHPVANDLRFVVAILKINNDLERIADQAVNIAERSKVLAGLEKVEIPLDLFVMVDKTEKMLDDSLDALVNTNADLAYQVILADNEIDTLNREMFKTLQEKMRHNPDRIEQYINLLSISRQLERTADQVTNIAEDVIYLVNAVIVRHTFD